MGRWWGVEGGTVSLLGKGVGREKGGLFSLALCKGGKGSWLCVCTSACACACVCAHTRECALSWFLMPDHLSPCLDPSS